MSQQTDQNTALPFIVFRVHGELYCVNSRDITAIIPVPSHKPVPNAPACVTGMFHYQNGVYNMLDLRSVFSLRTMEQEFTQFGDMIDARKQDHIEWVNELERSIKAEEPFTLATDPHCCKFGQWYDNFHTENSTVQFVLHKIDEPHRLLHQAAVEVQNCAGQCESCTRAECLKSILDRAKEEYMPEILSLLDETKEIFKSHIYHEMVLVLNGSEHIGVVVDEVLSVEDLLPLRARESMDRMNACAYLTSVYRTAKAPDMILELDVPALLDTLPKSALPEAQKTRV